MSHVKAVITPLMGRELPIVVVQNVTGRHKGAPVKYSVKMTTVADSSAIRTKFGSFFVGGKKDSIPDEYKKISIRNRVTPETKIRIELLMLLAKRYRDSNPGSKVSVSGFDPRPLIKIQPASSASDRRVKVYNYIEAVRTLPTNFTEAEAESIYRVVNAKFEGKLRSLFLVLSDDVFSKRLRSESRSRAKAAKEADHSGGNSSGSGSGGNSSGHSKGKGANKSSTRSTSQKRGASSSPSEPSAKK